MDVGLIQLFGSTITLDCWVIIRPSSGVSVWVGFMAFVLVVGIHSLAVRAFHILRHQHAFRGLERVAATVAHQPSSEVFAFDVKPNKLVEVNGRGGVIRSFHLVRELREVVEQRCPPVPHLLRSPGNGHK